MDISEQIREIELQAWRELGEKRKRERESERVEKLVGSGNLSPILLG